MKLKRILSLLLCAAMLAGMVCTTAFAEDAEEETALTQVSVGTADAFTAALQENGNYEITVTADLSYSSTTSVYVGTGTKVVKSTDGEHYTSLGSKNLTIYCSNPDTDLTIQDFTVYRVYLQAAATGSTLTFAGDAVATSYIYLQDTTNSTTLNVQDTASVSRVYTGYGTINIQDQATLTTLSNSYGTVTIGDQATVTTSTISSGATATVSGSASLGSMTVTGTADISGNVTSSGTLTVSSGATANVSGDVALTTVTVNSGGTLKLSDNVAVGGTLTNKGAAYLNNTGGSVETLSVQGTETKVSGGVTVNNVAFASTLATLTLAGNFKFTSLTHANSSSNYTVTTPYLTVTQSISESTIPFTIGSSSYPYDGHSSILVAVGDGYTLTEDDLKGITVTLTLAASGEVTGPEGYGLTLDEEANAIYYGPTSEGWTISFDGMEADEDGTYTVTASKDNYNADYSSASSSTSALVTPAVIVKDASGTTLKEGTDYTVAYKTTTTNTTYSSTGKDTATITIVDSTGDLKYTYTYYIQRQYAPDIFTVTQSEAMEYVTFSATSSTESYVRGYQMFLELLSVADEGGNEAIASPRYSYVDGAVVTNDDYNTAAYDYQTNVSVTAAGSKSYYVTFQGIYYGRIQADADIAARDLTDNERVNISVNDAAYTGEAVEPEVYVTYTNILGTEEAMTVSTNYTVEYSDNINLGTGTVTITGAGSNYTGSATAEFSIFSWNGEMPVTNQAMLEAALASGYKTIYVGSDFGLYSPVEINYEVTIKSYAYEGYTGDYTITGQGMTSSQSMFVVNNGGSLTLDDITIDGHYISSTVGTGLVTVSEGGSVTIGEGAVLQNALRRTSAVGAALTVASGAEATVNGTIRDCYSMYSCIYNAGTLTIGESAYLARLHYMTASSTSGYCAIYNTGTMYWEGGTFDADWSYGYMSYSTVAGYGGTVIYNAGTFSLASGTINGFLLDSEGNNTEDRTPVYYGAVLNAVGGTFTMSGGTIQGFDSTYSYEWVSNASYYPSGGGGVNNRGSFLMGGGTITGNTANKGGGVCNSGTFQLYGGEITGNAANCGGGVYNASAITFNANGSSSSKLALTAGTFIMTGGVISGNTLLQSEFDSYTYYENDTVNQASSHQILSTGGSAIYISGGSTATISRGTVTGDETVTANTTSLNGDNETVSVNAGIMVAPSALVETNFTYNYFPASVEDADAYLTITGTPTIDVGIVLVKSSITDQIAYLYNTSDLDLDDKSTYVYSVTSDDVSESYEGYLILDGSLGISLNVSTLDFVTANVNFSNSYDFVGSGLSIENVTFRVNDNGDQVAQYGDHIEHKTSDADLLNLYVNSEAVDASAATVYLGDDGIYICTHEDYDISSATPVYENQSGVELDENGNYVATSCTEDGSYDVIFTCPDCGLTIMKETETVAATGHTQGEAVKENETASGYDSVIYCTACGEELSRVSVSVSSDIDEAYTEDALAAAESITDELTGEGSTLFDDIAAAVAQALNEAEFSIPSATSSKVTSALTEAAKSEEGWTVSDGAVTYNGESAEVQTSYTTGLSLEITACDESGLTFAVTPTVQIVAAATTESGETLTTNVGEATTVAVTGSYTVTLSLADLLSDADSEAALTVTVNGEAFTGYSYDADSGELTLTLTGLPAVVTAALSSDDEENEDETYTASFTWSDDCSSATATLTGSSGDDTQTVTAAVTSQVIKAATCTETGQVKYTATVTYNGVTYTEDKTVTTAATGEHTYTGEVTTAATYTTKGVMTYTCSVCGASYTEDIAVITSSFLFDDVQDASASYYGPVYWAYDNGITTGTTATTFSPSKTCTRGQFVTFLWRLAGQPIVSADNPFTDVTDTSASYYYAVLWAVKNGVTKGTSETTFSPSQTITRAQAVTMLYRYAGEPAVSASSSFTDVTNTSASYYYAVQWAVQNGITNGTSKTTFSPSSPCTRGQMVTFLYRFAVEPLS